MYFLSVFVFISGEVPSILMESISRKIFTRLTSVSHPPTLRQILRIRFLAFLTVLAVRQVTHFHTIHDGLGVLGHVAPPREAATHRQQSWQTGIVELVMA